MSKPFTSPVLAIIVAALTPQGFAADSNFCEYYARDLISVPHLSSAKIPLCQHDQEHWNTNKNAHIQWCLTATEDEANEKRYAHNRLVNLCNDTDKIIMIDRQRTAQLALSADEEKKMQPLQPELKELLTTGKIDSPYRQLYPNIAQAQTSGVLKGCDLKSLPVDLDNNTQTQEWVISSDLSCPATPEKEHIWLLQRVNNQYRILFEGEDITLTIRYTEHNGYKNLAIATELPKQESSNKRCGAIKAEWHYTNGRYLPFMGEADAYGNCLPPYNLPDNLQGQNTFSMSKQEWTEAMKQEEQQRKANITSFEEALSDYIPYWISNMEQRIAAAANTTPLVTMPTTEAKRLPDETGVVKEPGLLDKIKTFIGLD